MRKRILRSGVGRRRPGEPDPPEERTGAIAKAFGGHSGCTAGYPAGSGAGKGGGNKAVPTGSRAFGKAGTARCAEPAAGRRRKQGAQPIPGTGRGFAGIGARTDTKERISARVSAGKKRVGILPLDMIH